MNYKNIIIAGYGVFGSALLNYIRKHTKDIYIKYIIEPNRHKRDLLKKLGYQSCEHILDVPANEIRACPIVVDCSPRGSGIKNLYIYKELGLKAIFQNGEEEINNSHVFYPNLVDDLNMDYIKIPLCSGIALIKLLDAIKKAKLTMPDRVDAVHCKVSNTARMITTDYHDSSEQLKILLGIETKMDVIYLRGEPYMGEFTYFGKINLYYKNRSPARNSLLSAIKNYDLLDLVSENYDLILDSNRAYDKTLIIKESVERNDDIISLINMSSTPEVNFPVVLAAINYLNMK